MDPLTAISLAGNLIQFVDFTWKLFAAGKELLGSAKGATASNIEIEVVAKELRSLSLRLEMKFSQQPPRNDEEAALVRLCEISRGLSKELIDAVQTLIVNKPHSKWQTFRKAIESVWKQPKIKEMEDRLAGIRAQISVHLLTVLVERQSSLNSFVNNLSAKYSRLEVNGKDDLEDIKHSILVYLRETDVRYAEAAAAISKLVSNGNQMQRETELLSSLKFTTMYDRRHAIFPAHQKTFEWVFRSHTQGTNSSGFYEWLQFRSGIFWIAGKAGSGKSTLMSFVCDHETTKSALGHWCGQSQLVMASFFFWNGGTIMQKSQEGLLRSILFEIWRQCPNIIPDFESVNWSKSSQIDDQSYWTLAKLISTLKEASLQHLHSMKFCFFIDGLDEYKGDHWEIIKLLQIIGSSQNIKLCVSSRPWNVFDDAFGRLPDRMMVLQDFTKDDITIYVREALETHPHFNAHKSSYAKIIVEIAKKAQGVFLWVFLVVRSIHRGLTNADSAAELERRLEQFPADLEKYFLYMLNSIEDFYREDTSKILLSCLKSPHPLPALTFSLLDQPLAKSTQPEIYRISEEEYEAKCAEVKKRLNARCLDLVELIVDDQALLGATIQFLHRTVRDFLSTANVYDLLVLRAPQSFEIHNLLCESLVAQISFLTPPLWKSTTASDALQLLLNMFMFHAREGEFDGESAQFNLIDEADKVVTWHLHNEPLCSHLTNETSVLKMCVEWGLQDYIAYKIDQDGSLINMIGDCVPLDLALSHSHLGYDLSARGSATNLSMVEFLLSKKASPNQYDTRGTVWSQFLLQVWTQKSRATVDTKKLWAKVIELMVNHGADISPIVEESIGDRLPHYETGTFGTRRVHHRIDLRSTVREICTIQDVKFLNGLLNTKIEENRKKE